MGPGGLALCSTAMKRITSYPENHWTLAVDIPYSMGVRCGDLMVLSGQMDFKGDGLVQNPGDLRAQSHLVLDRLAQILTACEATPDDVVKTYQDMLVEIEVIAMIDD